MIPTNNGNVSPCNPMSSDCVIWQGPDIPCIDLCNGDSISIVISRLAEKLCDLIEGTCDCNPDLTGLDLKCIPAPTPLPSGDSELKDYLQLIIDYICNLPTPGDPIGNVQLANCLQFNDEQGNLVTSLPIQEFAVYIGNEICRIKEDIAFIQNQLTDIITRIVTLEACVLPCDGGSGTEATVLSSCIINQQTPVPVSTLLLALETQFCNLRDAVGDTVEITSAINATCLYGTTGMLSQSSTYGSQNNWVQNPNTLATINQNQWIAICDIYNAVLDIQNNCCTSDCKAVIFAATHSVQTNAQSGLPVTLNLNFTGSTIPQGYSDCGTSSVTVSDSNGNQINQLINVAQLSNDAGGLNIDLQLSGLILTQSLSVAIQYCVSDGSNQCQDTQTISIPLGIPCPSNVTLTAQSETSIYVSFTTTLTSGYSFQLQAVDAITGIVAESTTIGNPSAAVSHTFTNLASATDYDIILLIQASGSELQTPCNLGQVRTTGITCNDQIIQGDDGGSLPIDYDAYLGYRKIGDTGKQIYTVGYNLIPGVIYSYPNGNQPTSNSPNVLIQSVDANGNVAVQFEDNNLPTGQMQYSYSSDEINYTGINNINFDQLVNISTGITSGSIFIKCIGINQSFENSIPTIARYDFGTGDITVIHNSYNCSVQHFNTACPVGVPVSINGLLTLNAQIVDQTIPGGVQSRNIWYYVGKRLVQGQDKYIFAGWNTDGHCTKVIASCDCPAFILRQPTITVGKVGTPATFELPYVLGGGTATFTITSNPSYGTLTQASSTDQNKFTYTPGVVSSAILGDTFEVELTSSIAGDCASTTAIIQIQFRNGGGINPKNGDLSVIVDTNSYPVTTASRVASMLDDVKKALQEECPTWTGDIRIIPAEIGGRWLEPAKAFIDDGKSITLSSQTEWTDIQNLPPAWEGGANTQTDCTIVVLSNSSSGAYSGNTLSQGWVINTGVQPSGEYMTDYVDFIDIQQGTQVGTWAKTNINPGSPKFELGLSVTYMPITLDQSGITAAAILQGLGSYAGQMIPADYYGIPTAVDVTGYLLLGAVPSATNPYESAVTPEGVTIRGLYNSNVNMFLDQSAQGQSLVDYLDSVSNDLSVGGFKEKFVSILKGLEDTCPSDDTDPFIRLTRCDNPEITLSIENTGGQIAPTSVVRTVDSLGALACWTASDVEPADGSIQAFTTYPDCPTCEKSLAGGDTGGGGEIPEEAQDEADTPD